MERLSDISSAQASRNIVLSVLERAAAAAGPLALAASACGEPSACKDLVSSAASFLKVNFGGRRAVEDEEDENDCDKHYLRLLGVLEAIKARSERVQDTARLDTSVDVTLEAVRALIKVRQIRPALV